ncbi:MAG TPA: LLM class flavin-dependent oxidoreductase [Roseiflexaceae bacterium]|nr:LLM class flavin-dependent oxidoreductase [Roseiflexaceae bacterium]
MQIGGVLSIRSDEQSTPRYRDVRALALEAETQGLDSIWLYDHLLFRVDETDRGQWECFTLLAALAEATKRVELGPLVACAPFRNPALLAKIAVTIDEVSDGRFTLGIGAGWNEAEFRAFGFPFDHRVDRLEEAVQIIGPLLHQGQVNFSGRYEQALDCAMVPRGPRTDGPRLMVAAFKPRMQRLAARYADHLTSAFELGGPEARVQIEAACTEVGRDPATLELSHTLWAAFPDLGPVPDHMRDNTYASADALAADLERCGAIQLDHVMVDFRPNTPAALERLAAAARLYRG